jgi:hypothetical protein
MMLHRFWIGPPRPENAWITAVVRRAHPSVEVVDWTWDTLPATLQNLLDSDDDPVHLSNMVRYWTLHEFGGLGLDHDVIPLRDLTGSPSPWTAALGDTREGSAMWFPAPGHPMLADLLGIGFASSRGLLATVRAGAARIQEVGARYPDVGYERRVLPIDAIGQRVSVDEVWAVHLWCSTGSRVLT